MSNEKMDLYNELGRLFILGKAQRKQIKKLFYSLIDTEYLQIISGFKGELPFNNEIGFRELILKQGKKELLEIFNEQLCGSKINATRAKIAVTSILELSNVIDSVRNSIEDYLVESGIDAELLQQQGFYEKGESTLDMIESGIGDIDTLIKIFSDDIKSMDETEDVKNDEELPF